MRFARVVLVLIVACFGVLLSAQDVSTAHHVSGMVPVNGVARELSAERPLIPSSVIEQPKIAPQGNTWTLLATIPGAVIHDISFPTMKIGFAAAEGGQVWKTVDGGKTWNAALNLGYPYYFYGVHALNSKDIVVSGFYDTQSFEGLIRWSHDGGKTWGNDIVLTSTGWVQRVSVQKKVNGLILDLIGGSENTAQYTSDGGASASDWTTVVDNSDGGWFGLQFSFLKNLHARASGINFCTSLDGGAQWNCGPSIDPVFDGETFFFNDKVGWVAGGEISPSVEGWVHLTTDGGKTWSGRTLDGPWPIREVLFLNKTVGWAAGGNIYSGVGGIYFSNDGGNTWALDVNTGSEMDACAAKKIKTGHQVWCAGYDASFNGHVYSTTVN